MTAPSHLAVSEGKVAILEDVCRHITEGNPAAAHSLLKEGYPFTPPQSLRKSVTPVDALRIFIRDRFIDRYSGSRLVFPGSLKILSNLYPEDFPYHPHGKMTNCHIAFWDLLPSIDHVFPLALGGKHHPDNMVTTCMRLNAIKANWCLNDIGWTIHPIDEATSWDGLTGWFKDTILENPDLLKDSYIKKWLDSLHMVEKNT